MFGRADEGFEWVDAGITKNIVDVRSIPTPVYKAFLDSHIGQSAFAAMGAKDAYDVDRRAGRHWAIPNPCEVRITFVNENGPVKEHKPLETKATYTKGSKDGWTISDSLDYAALQRSGVTGVQFSFKLAFSKKPFPEAPAADASQPPQNFAIPNKKIAAEGIVAGGTAAAAVRRAV